MDKWAIRGEGKCNLTTRWSGPWTIVGRTLVANSLLACSACGERRRGRPLNSVVRRHPNSLAMKYIVATFIICASIGAAAQDRGCGKRPVITTKLEDGTSIGVLVSEAQHKK